MYLKTKYNFINEMGYSKHHVQNAAIMKRKFYFLLKE